MSVCTNCNWKWYNTVYKWEWWYTDFWPMKYIETTPMWIQKVPCSKCNVKEEVKELKEITWQTTQQMLQEIQDVILKRLYPDIDIQYKDLCFLCYNEEEIYLLSWVFWFNAYDAIERIKWDYKDIWIMLYINSNDKKYVGITSWVYDLYKGKIYRVYDWTTNDIEEMRNSFYKYHSNTHKPTLSRVLSALGDEYFYTSNWIYTYWRWDQRVIICPRKLLNDNKSDAMLDSQSPETIKAIREIICK